jgi:hypothetical protein
MILYKPLPHSACEDRSAIDLRRDTGDQEKLPKHHVLTLFRWVVYLMLFGYLVFAHGCHGDVDDELFMAARSTLRQSIGSAP